MSTINELRHIATETDYHPAQNIAVGLTTSAGFELSQRAAKMLASSTLVPQEYRGNMANCCIALNMAARIGADPLQVMQNLVVIHGRPTWSAQFLIATFNSCGRFSALRFEFFGEPGSDGYGCRAYATERVTGEKLVGSEITIGLAKAEGWYGRNGSKWKTMSQQMLMYRAAAWFVRAYAPELSMGLQTAEEAFDSFEEAPKLERAERLRDLIVPNVIHEETEGFEVCWLDYICDLIEKAETKADLDLIKEDILAYDGADQAEAKKRYKKKFEALKKAKEADIKAAESEDTYQKLCDLVDAAKTEEDIDNITGQVGLLRDPAKRQAIMDGVENVRAGLVS